MIEDHFGEIGRKRSGVGCGEIDFSIRPYNISKLSEVDLRDLERTFSRFSRRVNDYIYEARHGKSKYRFFDFGFFTHMFSKDNDGEYNLWPIKFKLKDGSIKSDIFFQGHGFQVGWNNSKRVYGWTIHFGRFLIVIGDRKIER